MVSAATRLVAARVAPGQLIKSATRPLPSIVRLTGSCLGQPIDCSDFPVKLRYVNARRYFEVCVPPVDICMRLLAMLPQYSRNAPSRTLLSRLYPARFHFEVRRAYPW